MVSFEKISKAYDKYAIFCATQPEEIIHKTINGAGPSGKGNWVRDTLFYKYCVTNAANIHDFLYSEYGVYDITRKEADEIFLINMLINLERQSETLSKTLNMPLVYAYYYAVRTFGWSFWTKNKRYSN